MPHSNATMRLKRALEKLNFVLAKAISCLVTHGNAAGLPMAKERHFKNWICAFYRLFFQNQYCWHFDFLINQIFWEVFIIFKNWGIGVKYCWNYEPSKLLLHFIKYRLHQLNNKHIEIAVRYKKIQFFAKSYFEKKYLVKFEMFWVTQHKMKSF